MRIMLVGSNGKATATYKSNENKGLQFQTQNAMADGTTNYPKTTKNGASKLYGQGSQDLVGGQLLQIKTKQNTFRNEGVLISPQNAALRGSHNIGGGEANTQLNSMQDPQLYSSSQHPKPRGPIGSFSKIESGTKKLKQNF